MAEVPDRFCNDFFDSHRALLAMKTGPQEVPWRNGAEDARDLSARDVDHGEFNNAIALSIGKRRGEERRVGEGERRLVFGEDSFYTVCEDRLGIGEVAQDFEGAPLATDRPRDELLCRHSTNEPTDFAGACEIVMKK